MQGLWRPSLSPPGDIRGNATLGSPPSSGLPPRGLSACDSIPGDDWKEVGPGGCVRVGTDARPGSRGERGHSCGQRDDDTQNGPGRAVRGSEQANQGTVAARYDACPRRDSASPSSCCCASRAHGVDGQWSAEALPVDRRLRRVQLLRPDASHRRRALRGAGAPARRPCPPPARAASTG